MGRLISVALAVLLVVSLTACSSSLNAGVPSSPSSPPSGAPTSDLGTVLWHVHAHGGPINDLTVNPTNSLLAVADDNTQPLHLFDATTGAEESGPGMQGPAAQAIGFSPDGTLLAIGGYSGILLFDVSTAKLVATLAHPTDSSVDALAWSPDGKYLAAGHRPGRGGPGDIGLSIFDVATKTEVFNYSTAGWVDALAWSASGSMLAAGVTGLFGPPSLEIIDASHLTHLRSIATTVRAHGLTWQASSGTFWSTDVSTIHRWNPATGADDPLDIPGVAVLAAQPNAVYIAAGYSNGTVALLDGATAKPIVLATHAKGVGALAWSPDGTTLYSGDGAGIVTRTVVVTGANASFRLGGGRSYGVDWSPDDSEIVTGGDDGAIRVWNATNGALIAETYAVPSPYGIDAVAWSPDGTTIAVMGDSRVELLDASTLAIEKSFAFPVYYSDTDMAWSHDGTKLALAGNMSYAAIWDTRSATETQLPVTGNAIAWGPADKRVVVGGPWDWGSSALPTVVLTLANNQQVDLQTAPVIVQAVAWGSQGVAVGLDNAVDIFSPDTGKVLEAIKLGDQAFTRVFGAQWDPSQTRLAIASDYDGTLQSAVTLWNASTGTLAPVLPSSSLYGTAGALAWSHDGKELAVTDWEGNLVVASIGK